MNNKNYEKELNVQDYIKENILSIGYLISIYISVIYVTKSLISIDELFLFNSILYYFIEPFKNIMNLNYNFIYIKNIFNRINDLLIIKSNKESISNKSIIGNIRINNLK